MSNRSLQFLIYATIGIVAFVVGIAVMQFANSGATSAMSISGSKSCNISLIKTEGALYTYTFVPTQGASNNEPSNPSDGAVDAGEITKAISDADANPAINAIVLQIDSGGGGVVAGEEIANALKRAKKPTVALIRAQGLSAA